MNIQIELTKKPKQKPDFSKGMVPFGKIISDHMFLMDYNESDKWHSPRIVPHGMLHFDPATTSFHYAQSIFEGMKAYKTKDGEALLFRPYENADRFNKSAYRMYMPQIDQELFVTAISKLVDIEKDWIPTLPGTSLYIRPFMMATEATLNLNFPETFMFCVLLSPVGLLSGSFKPVRILVEEHYVRAAPGGTGFAKCAGNYAGAMRASMEAKDKGYDQVLWLDATTRKNIEEVSAMNVFFIVEGKLVTPAAGDTILDGITRKSVIEIANDWGIKVEERLISIDEIIEAYKSGKVQEAFSAGTAAVITPIGTLAYKSTTMVFNEGETGELTKKIFEEITGIQTGAREDNRNWTYKI